MWDFLNNSSIGAFIGAFAAFFLVVITDWRRRRRYKKLLTFLVSDNLDHARHKIEAVRMSLSLIKEDGRVTDAPFMCFPTQSIKDYQFQVLDMLNANEKQGLDALVFWMESIDSLLGEATKNAGLVISLIKNKIEGSEELKAIDNYVIALEEAEINLSNFIKLAGYYVKGESYKIIEFSHPVGDSKNT